MVSLGSFGVERPQVDMEFDYFGHVIRVHPDASDLRTVDMLMHIGDLEMTDEANASIILQTLQEQLFGQIHPDDRDLFWRLAMENRQTQRDLLAITKAITEALSDFPTQQPSDSLHTPTADATNYAPASRQQRRALQREADKGNTKAALTLLQGRPDLQKVVVDRDSWLASQTG